MTLSEGEGSRWAIVVVEMEMRARALRLEKAARGLLNALSMPDADGPSKAPNHAVIVNAARALRDEASPKDMDPVTEACDYIESLLKRPAIGPRALQVHELATLQDFAHLVVELGANQAKGAAFTGDRLRQIVPLVKLSCERDVPARISPAKPYLP